MAIKHELIQQWKKDEKTPFKGWDFSYLKGRIKEEKPTWNYILTAKKLIKRSNSVLDMATGGGEIFSEILSDFRPNRLIAIEGYKPNVSIVIRKLRKYGVRVIYANETRQLPFKESEFDLILNRHGGLNIKELTRIITEGGLFLTQQVGGDNLKDLIKEFGFSPKCGKFWGQILTLYIFALIFSSNSLNRARSLYNNPGVKSSIFNNYC
jgi:ubiquinone/menaquinone biosynthesis C-methylase UbiE